MVCASNKQNSNNTGLAFALEACLKTLPTTAVDGFEPTWYGLEPNSYADFGGDIKTTARQPIEPGRQNKKGTVTDLDASGGFNHDFINDLNGIRLLQGFFFADVREAPTTKPFNGSQAVVSSVTAADDKYNLAATGIAFNIAGLLVHGVKFAVAANNAIGVVVSADANDITVGAAPGLTDEPAPPAGAYVEVIGYEFGTAEAGITKTGNLLVLTDSANKLATLPLNVGQWIYIGGDAAANADSFVNNKGYARIKTIAAGAVAFDDTTFAGATETSAAKKVRIFFGAVIRNEKTPSLIKRRSYHLERTLGDGPTAVQAEYLVGAVPNELKLNIPGQDKLNVDLAYVACDNKHRTGEVGDTILSLAGGSTFVAAAGADAYNTTSDVFRMKLYVQDATTTQPSALFGYVTEGNLTINNGVTPDKAVGVLGAFDTSAGNFVVSGSLTAFFTTVAAVKAVRANANVGFNAIFAKQNAGYVWDIPLLGLGGGRLNVEKDRPIMVPLEPQAAECAAGYTLMFTYFRYLPTVAMPT